MMAGTCITRSADQAVFQRILRMSLILAGMVLGFAALAECPTPLRIGSWNTKHLGRKGFLTDKAVVLLSSMDVVALQEVNKGKQGNVALESLKRALSKETVVKWCSVLSPAPTDSRERYAYLFRNDKIAWVNEGSGAVIDDCTDTPFTSKLASQVEAHIVREPSIALFQSKVGKGKFYLASVHLVPTNKGPTREAPFVFQAFTNVTFTKALVIVAGDYNLTAGSPAFHAALKSGWIAGIPDGTRTSIKNKTRELSKAYDNIFYSKVTSCRVTHGVVNSLAVFRDMPEKEIYKNLSDHLPVFIELGE